MNKSLQYLLIVFGVLLLLFFVNQKQQDKYIGSEESLFKINSEIIDKIFGFLFGFIFNYIIFSTVIYGINNFEFLNNLENFLLENSFLLQELNTFNNNLLTNIFYNEDLNSN